MEVTTHPARIVGPVVYRGGTGRRQKIPLGPCLVETVDGQSIEVVWGARGERSASLPLEEVAAARHLGHLVLLD
jgi:hypothetical protein